MKPVKIHIRTYQVGFGDCFLITFEYSEGPNRNMLIDFGSTGLPSDFSDSKKSKPNGDKPRKKINQMLAVANNIKETCGDNGLDVLVVTHRHKDHMSGFGSRATAEIISQCKPKLVIQPWTEEPDLAENARQHENLSTFKITAKRKEKMALLGEFKENAKQFHIATLQNMQKVAESVVTETDRLSQKRYSNGTENPKGFLKPVSQRLIGQLSFIGEDNVSNVAAIKNLSKISENAKSHYVYYGYEDDENTFAKDIAEILPNIRVRVIGPPTIEQHEEIFNQREKDDSEFWMLQAINKNYWGLQAATTDLLNDLSEKNTTKPNRIFPKASVYNNFTPSHTRWFIRQVRELRAEQLLGIVTILDDSLNNTSVILLIEVGNQKLLFPGDAQIENWEYVLKKEKKQKDAEDKRQDILDALKKVTFYKVGHHGSRNATPKTLWNSFSNKSTKKDKSDRLKSVVSTLENKHGDTVETAVPRESLVKELKKLTDFSSTQDLKYNEDHHLEENYLYLKETLIVED